MIKIVVSACLLGSPVRYDGRDKKSYHPVLQRWLDEGRVISACPEMLGGLGTPRPPAEIIGDGVAYKVVTPSGADVTSAFEKGAHVVGEQVSANGVRMAILKEGSPSCGTSFVYDGTFTGTRVPGRDGITAAFLRKQGIAVFSEEQLDEAALFLERVERDTPPAAS